jgi:type IV secretory pathway VirB9-like protein
MLAPMTARQNGGGSNFVQTNTGPAVDSSISAHRVAEEAMRRAESRLAEYQQPQTQSPGERDAQTSFTYPDGDAAAWKRHVADVERDHQLIAAANDRPPMLPAIRAAEELDFNYVVMAKNPAIKPTKVFSDAAHTYFRMPEAIKAREAPALFVVNAEGKDELTNYRVADGTVPTYVVDRLADHFRLRLGVGKKAEVVEIKHGLRERT